MRVYIISLRIGAARVQIPAAPIVDFVWPALADSLSGNLSIALPVPSLADLGLADAAPALQNATLALTVQQAGVEDGYLRLSADLTLEAPQP